MRMLMSKRRLFASTLMAACGAFSAAQAQAEDKSEGQSAEPEPAARSTWLVGAALLNTPEYAGASANQLKLRPLWAYQYGRFRFSTSRAGGLLGFGGEARGPGASADLLSSDRVKLGLALRFDNGRQSSDAERLHGLQDVKRTLRGRLYLAYAVDAHWSASASVSQDLLGRKGGAQGGLDLGYRWKAGHETEWSLGGGLGLADRRYMRSYFGISPEGAAASGLPVFEAGAGLRDLHLGAGVTRALGRHWVGFGSLGWSRLQGDAADSPVTQNRSNVAAGVGAAYRW